MKNPFAWIWGKLTEAGRLKKEITSRLRKTEEKIMAGDVSPASLDQATESLKGMRDCVDRMKLL